MPNPTPTGCKSVCLALMARSRSVPYGRRRGGSMDNARPTTSDEEPRTSRFELAPPRRFVLPAILLLLSEAPGHGYSLEKDLREMNFGRIDRPTVYRALAQLEKDGLVESRADVPAAGHERRVYGVTPLGERVLGVWMSVIKEERDLLGRVLRRYQATGAPDATLAEVDGGWAAALGSGWSPVSPTSMPQRHLRPVAADRFDAWLGDNEEVTDAAGGDGNDLDASDGTSSAGRRGGATSSRRTGPWCSSTSAQRSGRSASERWASPATSMPSCPVARSTRRRRPPHTWRSRWRACARGTASTTPSSCGASTPGATRRPRSSWMRARLGPSRGTTA